MEVSSKASLIRTDVSSSPNSQNHGLPPNPVPAHLPFIGDNAAPEDAASTLFLAAEDSFLAIFPVFIRWTEVLRGERLTGTPLDP